MGDDPRERVGKVNFGGIVKEVNLACVPEAKVGEYVIVHVGFAISQLDEEEANQTLEYLRQINELEAARRVGLGPPPEATRD
jgi:hydrogenase expression/formation protein HypC